MTREAWKKRVCEAIDSNRQKIISIGEEIYKNPELGYKENFASDLVASALGELGLEVERNLAVTGCSAVAKGGSEGPTIAVMGELDAVVCSEHPDAHPATGAVHACGHHVQVAAMLGVAMGLVESKVLENLGGKVAFLGVPAEEYIELAYREKLKAEGKVQFYGGKQELIAKGYFDNIDIAMMVHVLNLGQGEKKVLVGGKGNGFVGKKVQFIGKESHAGGAPHLGINALNAAMLAINNIHAQRETFPEEERIRVHPIITKGGDIVNVVPADVRMESYVRGRTIKGIVDANQKVNRALLAGGMAVGAQVKITESPGYLPLLNTPSLDQLFQENAEMLVGQGGVQEGGDFTGSFDFGDLSHLMPSLHPFVGGVTGDLHTREFRIADPELAYILPAKAMAMTIIDLLWDDAKGAKEVMDGFRPAMTKEEYLAFQQSVSKEIVE